MSSLIQTIYEWKYEMDPPVYQKGEPRYDCADRVCAAEEKLRAKLPEDEDLLQEYFGALDAQSWEEQKIAFSDGFYFGFCIARELIGTPNA